MELFHFAVEAIDVSNPGCCEYKKSSDSFRENTCMLAYSTVLLRKIVQLAVISIEILENLRTHEMMTS